MGVSPDQLIVVSVFGLPIALCTIRYLTRSRRQFFNARRTELRVARFEERARRARVAEVGIVTTRASERTSREMARAAPPNRGASRSVSKPLGQTAQNV